MWFGVGLAEQLACRKQPIAWRLATRLECETLYDFWIEPRPTFRIEATITPCQCLGLGTFLGLAMSYSSTILGKLVSETCPSNVLIDEGRGQDCEQSILGPSCKISDFFTDMKN